MPRETPTLDPVAAPPSQPRSWRVGSLVYTRSQLYNVFFWLLWGDFCLTIMDNGVVGTLVPLQLKRLGASDTAIGFVNGTVMAVMSAVFVSVISTTSDRTRTRWGGACPTCFTRRRRWRCFSS